MIMEAEADAEAEILRGEAKAFAIEARAKAEAEQVRVVRVFINYGVTCNLQSECFISEYYNYAMLKFVYEIGS